jgi:6-phosphogluconolactonase
MSTSTAPLLIYVGTYTKVGHPGRGRADGVYVYQVDPQSGALTHLHTVPDVANPSFIAFHPNGRLVYTVNEALETDGHPGGGVSAFARDPETGDLTFINREPSHGTDPCHLSVDPTGSNVLVANYSSGSVAVFPIDETGRLSPVSYVDQHSGSSVNQKRQQGPHAHAIVVDPSGKFALSPDLGMDQIFVYRLAANGQLEHNEPIGTQVAPGEGPRHLDFHPTKPIVYVINELGSSVSTFAWDAAAGTLNELQNVSTLPEGYAGETTCADIHVAPSGHFVYGSNRGHDSIAAFAIDDATGTLTPIGHTSTGGQTPRNFAIDPSGRFLFAANQNTDNVVTFSIDEATGQLTPTGQTTAIPSPVCLKFAPASGN